MFPNYTEKVEVCAALSNGIYKSYAKIQQNTVEVKYFVYLYSNLVNARFFLF